jgi:transposase
LYLQIYLDCLIAIILELGKQIKELKEQLSQSHYKKEPPKFIKPTIHRYHHKPGQKPGHEGITRALPAHIDETIEQRLKSCPHCHNELQKPAEVIEHIQEDIIPQRVRVTKYRRYRYWCKHCQAMVDAPYHNTEVPWGHLGPNVLTQAAILKYNHCLPYRKITQIFKELAGLEISPAALALSLQRISEWLGVERQTILTAIRASPTVHIDETGWRLDGKNHWLWAFVNERLAYYRIEPSRGRKIVKDTLANTYNGTIITDFYGVYFRLPYKRQKCLVHLLRELHRVAQQDTSLAYKKYYKAIKRIVNDAIRLKEAKPSMKALMYRRRFKRIKHRLFMLIGNRIDSNKNIQRIANRFSKYWLDMLTFLEEECVSYNNNLAERLIRPHVIYRNRSFGNRSPNGLRAHATLTSIIQSLLLQKRNVFESLKTAFVAHRQGKTESMLFTSSNG